MSNFRCRHRIIRVRLDKDLQEPGGRLPRYGTKKTTNQFQQVQSSKVSSGVGSDVLIVMMYFGEMRSSTYLLIL